MSNAINPEHYNRLNPQPKDVIRAWGLNFNLGSAVKYISRAGHKDDIVQDLKKAQEFIQFEIDAIEGARAERKDKPKHEDFMDAMLRGLFGGSVGHIEITGKRNGKTDEEIAEIVDKTIKDIISGPNQGHHQQSRLPKALQKPVNKPKQEAPKDEVKEITLPEKMTIRELAEKMKMHTDTKSHRMSVLSLTYPNRHSIRFCDGCKRMIVSLCMIRNAAAETAVTIKSQKGAGYSLTSTDRNGTTTHIRSISFFWNKLTQP